MAREGIYPQQGKRGVTYRAVVSAGTDPVTGKRRQLVRTFRTEREAVEWRLRTMLAITDGTHHEPSKETLGEYLTRWLASRRPEIAGSTWRMYESAIRVHIVPAIGRVPLGELRPDHIQDLYDALAGTSTPFKLHAVLRPALDRARRLGLVRRDLLDGVIVTGRHGITTGGAVRVWDAEQLALFLEAVTGHRFERVYRLLAATGMRIAEALALTWEAVDLAAATVRVTTAKTQSGRRTIPIDPDTVAMLAAQWREQAARREEMGPGWFDTRVVFDRGNGRPLTTSMVASAMDYILRHLDLPRLTPHGLRHTHASLLLQARRPVHYVSKRLGHASVMQTWRTYAHVIPQTDIEDADTYARIMGQVRTQRDAV